ncbi:hypothetical protein NM688_g6494 [Phlebia brevispora]|uniref:Uncharacterized protein n=1 Tax=Phlebia brevispora TaxID=194682 RepID=A0ACC1SFU4_9APHY|nr:hypothetical protein NM688_g6494 [Phlebia brevispora]
MTTRTPSPPQAQEPKVTPRNRTITTSAQNMTSNPSAGSDARADSRAAIKVELAGRLRFNDRSVLQRLGIDRITDKFVADCFSNFMNNSTHCEHWGKLRDVVRTAEATGRKNEIEMYPPLEYIFNYVEKYEWNDFKGCPGGSHRRFVGGHQQELSSEVHTLGFPSVKPDFSLLDPETPLVDSVKGKNKQLEKDNEPHYSSQWRYRSGFAEVKSISSQGPTSPTKETVTEIVQQAADYARLHMAARPFQLFSVGLLVYGLKFCVAIFDRNGATFSSEGSLENDQGWQLFLRVLIPATHPVIPALQAEASSLGITVPNNFPTFSVSLGDGRGTTVWLVKRLEGGVPEGSVKIMKTAWRSSRRTPEADIYKSLQTGRNFRSHACVAQFDEGGDVGFEDEQKVSVSALRKTMGIPQDGPQEDKILHRIFLSTVGRSIWEYESEEVLIRGIKAAVRGHKFLYENGILHRDISAGNVLLAVNPTEPGSEGFITDLDYAAISDDSPPARNRKVPHGGHITGTYQFMSIRLLDLMEQSAQGLLGDTEIITEVRDDLESFLWVFCYAIMRHHAVQYSSDAACRVQFRDTFGHLRLADIYKSRVSGWPVRNMRYFKKGLSAQLFQWFHDDVGTLLRGSGTLYDWETGFIFTHEALDEMLGIALSRVLQVTV